jgi:5-methylcytosine-specific restriction enzyme subunit McrC
LAAVTKVVDILEGRGFAAWEQVARKRLDGREHHNVELPPEMIRADGSLDVYPDVLKLFTPAYKDNKPVIRCAGWVGHIPLNDQYALEVTTRVPVGNLERLVGMAAGYSPKILTKYTRQFAQAEERPASFFDLLTDQLLDAFDHVWEFGLLKDYERRERIGSSPVGRILPFQRQWRSAKAGRPVAMSSAFSRTTNFGPNRVLRHAFEKLLAGYSGITADAQRKRIRRLRLAFHRLEDVARPSPSEITPAAIARYVRYLPPQHEHYADALMVAQLVIYDAGISIRDAGGVAILPSILIDMAKAFEDYIRRVIANELEFDPRITVKDGNMGGEFGAKVDLFTDVMDGITNPKVTPDIVIEVDGKPRLVIDAKYKPAPSVPDRDDINQAILYGARYQTDRVMLLHSERVANRQSVEHCGNVGGFKVYNGLVNLEAEPIEDEEHKLVGAIKALL